MRSRTRCGSWGVLITASLLVTACGGGGGGGSDGGDGLKREIRGAWTSSCQARVAGGWRAETLEFDESTASVTHAGLQFATSDCSDQGVIQVQETGKYSAGKTIDCPSGTDFRCAEIDISWDSGSKGYGVYSVDETDDPEVLRLSDLKSDPTQRPSDVDQPFELRRMAFPDKVGKAILDVYLVDGGWSSSPPAPLAGYAWLPYDLNEGSGGHYIWLYYRTGRANGADGTPLGQIYTVDEADGETPKKGGTKLPVNLNSGPIVGHELWLYKRTATDTIMRCIAVANPTEGATRYGPADAEGKWPVVWVEELSPDSLKTPFAEYPEDVQDLNEGEGLWTDYIYIGYCPDR